MARVKARTRAGATIRLERGQASFAVVHRPGARWNVEVGPFEIAVTGTEFDVHWSDDRQGFEVVMKSGTVVVSGSLTGEGIPLHAGQRLVASLANKTLVVNEVAPRRTRRRDAPAPAHVVAPHDEAAPRPRRERLVAQAAPELTLRDVAARRPSRPRRWRACARCSPPPFEPAPRRRPPAAGARRPPAPAVSQLGMGGAELQRAAAARRSGSSTPPEGFRVLSGDSSAVFRNPVIDHTVLVVRRRFAALRCRRSTCDPSSQSGEAVIFLPHPVDLRGKTVTSASWCAARSTPSSRRASWRARATSGPATATTRT